MNDEIWHAIGLMSGTSLDGVDVAYVSFNYDALQNKFRYKIHKAKTYPYSAKLQNELKEAYHYSAKDLMRLDVDYGVYLGKIVNQFILDFKISKLDFVSSHGHTIFHNPKACYTLQIGHGAAIASEVKHKVICDFRTQDVVRGGQGAPLVPIGDKMLFSDYNYCLNIGGFANVSFDDNGMRKAFDVCPANILLNHYVKKMNKDYDDRGLVAASGTLSVELFKALNSLEVYKGKKSLSFEDIELFFLPLIDSFNLSVKDVLRTLVEHIAFKISENINSTSKILITGGGAYNTFLIDRLQALNTAEVIRPSKEIIDFKEALVFALLGLLKLLNKPNILASVTGVDADHSSGVIYMP